MNSNTSATGGYLVPAVSPAPIEGAALFDFFHDMIVGITELDATVVRPADQTEPPNIPQHFTVWAALNIGVRPADIFPAIEHLSDGRDRLEQHEEINVHVSIYDTGSSGLARFYATKLRAGLAIAQNREPLLAQNMGLVEVGDQTPVPSLLKERWLVRVDVPLVFRRELIFDYPVRNLIDAQGNITSDGNRTTPFNV